MKNSKHILQFVLVVAVFLPLMAFSQLHVYSFAQIDSLQKSEKRNVVVFIHTDWCRYCRAMKNSTFKNGSVIKLLNDKFWFAELNAEEKKEIIFNTHSFKYKPTGNNTGIHELAEQLGTVDGKIAYPALCILNPDYEIIFQYCQFLSSAHLSDMLNKILETSDTIRDK